ncbi:MAG: sigma-54-dependent Fis family transcriptional regulator [Geobacter sp.]|nr:sigma-54-dependent Fis family transcriptional regulator [Geobacter sp.]
MAKPKILICDDETEILRYLKKMLEGQGFGVETFTSGKVLLQRLESAVSADLLLQDVRMPDMDGIEVFRQVKILRPDLPVVIMTAYGSIDAAVEAIKLGAYDYITKPFPREKILGVLDNLLEREHLRKENRHLREELHGGQSDTMVFRSRKFQEVYDLTLQVAASDSNILILGESGTGKELIAATIHQNSPRRRGLFFSINCAALTETLLESQLFGHVRGAFTGAFAAQKGMLEEADGGTLFLDEVGDMSLTVQAKLLRVIQEREFIPVGSTRPKSVDIRFVAATNKDLEAEIRQGRFREDFFYRLNVITINLPPLRERPEDIEPLARHFLARFCTRMKKEIAGISDEALRLLVGYHWPGNARELENVMERAVILARSTSITPEILPIWSAAATPQPAAQSCAVSLEALEREHIRQVLEANQYHKSRSAELLGISRKTLDRKIAEYGLILPRQSA